MLAWVRGPPSDEDREVVLEWLRECPEVAAAEAGDLVDQEATLGSDGDPLYGHERSVSSTHSTACLPSG